MFPPHKLKELKPMTTELVKTEDFKLAIAEMDIATLTQSIADIAGPSGIDPRMMPKVHVPAGVVPQGQKPKWAVPDGESVDTIEGVLIHIRYPRALFEKPYKPGVADPPQCASEDSITGVGIPGGLCNGDAEKGIPKCEYNEWGTRKIFDPTSDSNAKACGEQRMLYVLRSGSVLPLTIQVSPGSLKPYTQFSLSMIDHGGIKFGYLVEFGLVVEGGYSQITFARKGKLSDDQREAVKVYAKEIVPFLDTASIRHEVAS